MMKADELMMQEKRINELGDELYQALRTQSTLGPLTEREGNITIEDAYHISLRMVSQRLNLDGERIVGKNFGFLTDKMEYADGANIPIAGNMIQPRAEGEIAFRLKQDLVGPGVTEQDVLDATATIMPCFEIVDSRIHNWNIKIQDTVADNASCGVYVLGTNEVDPRDFDLPNLKMTIFKNGEFNSEGMGSAVQGNPLTAVAWLANTLGEFGIPFKAGEIILSGSLVPLIPVVAGDQMSLVIEGIGGCRCKFV
jgi:2-oxopent-4-enoate/cis-2-oxohex-4-enoate hydratase